MLLICLLGLLLSVVVMAGKCCASFVELLHKQLQRSHFVIFLHPALFVPFVILVELVNHLLAQHIKILGRQMMIVLLLWDEGLEGSTHWKAAHFDGSRQWWQWQQRQWQQDNKDKKGYEKAMVGDAPLEDCGCYRTKKTTTMRMMMTTPKGTRFLAASKSIQTSLCFVWPLGFLVLFFSCS